MADATLLKFYYLKFNYIGSNCTKVGCSTLWEASVLELFFMLPSNFVYMTHCIKDLKLDLINYIKNVLQVTCINKNARKI